MPISSHLAWTWTNLTPLLANTSPAPGVEATAAWKAAYVVGGVLQNFNQTGTFTAERVLTPTGPWSAAPSGPASSGDSVA
jgi:hypothetical protein